jgi:hypothetical protein
MKYSRFAVALLFLSAGLSGTASAQNQFAQYYQAANSAYSTKNYDQAIKYYDAAVQSNPNYWQAFQGLGNCYYAKGQNAEALSNYQKALALNPNNPQLSSFVQALRAKVGTAPAATNTVQYSNSVVVNSDKNFQLSPMIGVAVGDNSGLGTGIGGGLRGIYMTDANLGFGGMIYFYTWNTSLTESGYYITQSYTLGTLTETISESHGNLEVLAAIQYKFTGGSVKPYLIGGAGLSALMFSESISFSYSSGTPLYNPTTGGSIPGTTSMYPMVTAGAGLGFNMGKDMDLYLEAKYDVVIGNGGTFSYIPIGAGLSFGL